MRWFADKTIFQYQLGLSVILTIFLVSTACCVAATEAQKASSDVSEFSMHAPPDTRLLVTLDTSSLVKLMPKKLSISGACQFDPSKDLLRVNFAFAVPMKWRVELIGALTVEKAGCLLGRKPGPDGTLDLGKIEIKSTAKGKLIVIPRGFAVGTHDVLGELVDLLSKAPSGATFAAAAKLKATKILAFSKKTRTEIRISYPSPAKAEHAKRLVIGLLGDEKKIDEAQSRLPREMKGFVSGTMIGIETKGRELVMKSGPDELPMAIRVALAEAFSVPGDSMRPSLIPGDKFFILKGPFREPIRRGTVIAYRTPSGAMYVKRVVALAGDKIAMKDGKLILNDKAVPLGRAEPFKYDALDQEGRFMGKVSCMRFEEGTDNAKYSIIRRTCNSGIECLSFKPEEQPSCDSVQGICAPSLDPITIPDGHVFVMGDNRDNSLDSRSQGPIPVSSIIGTAGPIWWSSLDGIRWERIGMPVR